MKRIQQAMFLGVTALFATHVQAQTREIEGGGIHVSINGTRVDGMTNATFEKVKVQLDAQGNVLIDAPGYVIKKITRDEVKPPTMLTRHYFLVTDQSVPGMAEYDVEISINGNPFRTVRSSESMVAVEITPALRLGLNAISMRATKRLEHAGSPKSSSKSFYFKIIIGEGTQTSGQMNVTKQLITFLRTAADTGDSTQEFTLEAK